jgi:hypothetical protein
VVWQQLGDVLRELGEDEEAVGVYRRALEIKPGLAEAKFGLEQLLRPQISQQKAIHRQEKEIKKYEMPTKNISNAESNLAANNQNPEVRLIAFYLPQYHPIPENDKWWGKGFTEWTNVTKAQPLFEGHYQPRLPADLGFYDLRLAEVREAQAKLARKYGIYGFCYYYYWFAGKRLLDRPVDETLQSKRPDFPFCLCWANENWTRRWDGSEHEILMAQEHSFENNKAFAESLLPFLEDKRYIRVNGKPLVLIYRANILPDVERTVQLWRDVWRDNGVGEVYLCGCLTFGLQSSQLIAWGFNAGVQFPPHGVGSDLIPPQTLGTPDYIGNIYDFRQVVENELKRSMASGAEKELLSVMTSWDNTARKGKAGNTFLYADPEIYELWLRGAIEKTKEAYLGDEKLVFINAWNEWAEGTYLEPDRKYGHAYLSATSRALNGVYCWQTAIKLLRYLPFKSDRHLNSLVKELKIRTESIQRSLEAMITQAKKAKLNCVLIKDIRMQSLDKNITHFDNPLKNKKLDSEKILFSGWSFNNNGQPVIAVKILDGDQEIANFPINKDRSDVKKHYLKCQQEKVGFTASVPAKKIVFKKPGYYHLDVCAICQDAEALPVATIDLKILEERLDLSGKLKTRIKWKDNHQIELAKILQTLKMELQEKSIKFYHLLDELEEILSYLEELMQDLKKFIIKNSR